MDREPRGEYEIKGWDPTEEFAGKIVREMDIPSWAPWLLEAPGDYIKRTTVFPDGQISIVDKSGQIAAYLTSNRIYWDGKPSSLETWDNIVGLPENTSCEQTFEPEGNTIVLLAITVNPEFKGQRLASKLLGEVRRVKNDLGIEHIISPFRPSGFGEWKKENDLFGNESFEKYCDLTREDQMPIDPWLRALIRNEIEMIRHADGSLAISWDSMKHEVSMAEFEYLVSSYKPSKWRTKEVEDGKVVECAETGVWLVRGDNAIYIEPNVWGRVK